MLFTLCALIALAKSKAKKPASLQAFLYLAPRPGLEQKNKHLFYNEIILFFKSIHPYDHPDPARILLEFFRYPWIRKKHSSFRSF